MTLNRSLALTAMLSFIYAGSPAVARAASARHGAIPLTFETNRGQAPASVQFTAHGDGYGLFLSPAEATMNVAGRGLRMKIDGANRTAKAAPDLESKAAVNYLVGKDPRAWRRDIPSYSRVKYENVYQGIDVVYYAKLRQLEYDFIVHPGARPEAIGMRFDGSSKIEIDAAGNLLVYMAGAAEPVRFHKPEIFQGAERVDGGYVLKGGRAAFRVAAYDHSKPLVIDPLISYSTYIGGSGQDSAQGIAVDAQGNAYITGSTTSTDFPVTGAALAAKPDGAKNKVFIAKVNAAGNKLLYCTYLGGSGDDFASSIAIDSAGNAYVAGNTLSADFPTVNAFQTKYGGGTLGDGWVAKLNPAGDTLLYSTYLGGNASDIVNAIALDSANNAVVTGQTISPDFPVSKALQATRSSTGNNFNVFVTKLDASGANLKFSTYLGGTGSDIGYTLAVDAAGNTVVAGQTNSLDFPVMNAMKADFEGGNVANTGVYHGFITKLNPDGSAMLYSTYFGGAWKDAITGLAVDQAGNTYLAGKTWSTNFPTVNAAQPALNSVGGYKSTDGGATWTPIKGGLDSGFVQWFQVDPANSMNVYAATRDRSIYASSDGGQTWSARRNIPEAVGVTGVRTWMMAMTKTSVLYAATVSPGGLDVVWSKDGGQTWTASPIPVNHVYIIAADPNNPGTLFYGVTSTQKIFKTTDGGENWTGVGSNITGILEIFAFDPTNSKNVYAAALDGIYTSTDGGDTWKKANTAGFLNQSIWTIAVDPTAPSTIYAGANGAVYKSADSGTTWKLVLTTPGNTNVSVVIDPRNGAVYAGGGANLNKSTDGGATWKSLVDSLPIVNVQNVALDPNNPSTVYVGQQVASDMFVAKLDAKGTLVYSTYLGGTGPDSGAAIAADAGGNAYITGATCSSDFPNVSNLELGFTGGCNSVPIIKLDASGSVIYSTVVTAQANFTGSGIAIDSAGNAYVAGTGSVAALPEVGGIQLYRGGTDAFVIKIKP